MSLQRLYIFGAQLVLLVAACRGTRWDFGGQEGEDMHDTGSTSDTASDTDTDTDSDSDSDTDTDTDTDSDTGQDTGDTGTRWTFDGPFTFDATDTAGTADRCDGTVELFVTGFGRITGTGSCTFSGALATAFPGGFDVTEDGAWTDTGDTGQAAAAGTFTFVRGASGEVLPWSGALFDTLSGTFTGSLSNGTTTVTVAGSFTGTPL